MPALTIKNHKLEKVRNFAQEQVYKADEIGNTDDCIGFDFEGVFIINPWTNENTTRVFDTDEAISYYGIDNMYKFCKEALAILNDSE